MNTDAGKLKAATTYDAAADHFDDEPLGFWARIGRRTIERLELPLGATVLNVGCGTGASALPAAEMVGPQGRVIGVDLAERLLEIARQKGRESQLANIQFETGDMERLGYPDDHFDAVVSVFSIFFIPDMARQISELWRMVRPGGWLGRVDGFDQDERASEGNEGSEVLRGLLAAQGDAFEALELAVALLDAGASGVEDFGKEGGLVFGVLAVGDDGADAAAARRLPVGLGIVALVAENGARRDVRADVEQECEIAAVAGLAAGQMESQRQTVEIGFQVDFRRKSAARAAEGLALLPPFAPAAETWARTIVESTI